MEGPCWIRSPQRSQQGQDGGGTRSSREASTCGLGAGDRHCPVLRTEGYFSLRGWGGMARVVDFGKWRPWPGSRFPLCQNIKDSKGHHFRSQAELRPQSASGLRAAPWVGLESSCCWLPDAPARPSCGAHLDHTDEIISLIAVLSQMARRSQDFRLLSITIGLPAQGFLDPASFCRSVEAL